MPPTTAGAETTRGPRGAFQWAAAAYLAALPLGIGFARPMAGTHATLADLFLVLFVAGSALALAAGRGRVEAAAGSPASQGTGRGEPARRGAGSPGTFLALLAGFGVWAIVAAAWSPHTGYALAKGGAYFGLAAGAAGLAWSGLGWERALDAWLVGTCAVLLLVAIALLAGGDGSVARIAYEGGSVRGLPLPRLRGPFLHPNAFGDYLVVSGLFLWARWPAWVAGLRASRRAETGESSPERWRGWVAVALGVLLLVALFLTVSTAWLGAGVLLVAWGRRITGAPRRGTVEGGRSRWVGWALRGSGAVLSGIVLAGLVTAIRIGARGVELTTSGIRPRIWASAVGAVLEAPLIGVGAAPYLAQAVDPADPSGGPVLWDAHSVYLSVLGQYGVVGFALLGGGVWLLVRRLRRPGGGGEEPDLAVVGDDPTAGPPPPLLRDRARRALLGAIIAFAVHGFVIAGEDLRHWWAVLGIAAMTGSRWRDGAARRREPPG